MNPSLWVCPFIGKKPNFSGLRFDHNRKNEIGCMYQFGTCNISIDFDSWFYLILSTAPESSKMIDQKLLIWV